MLAFFSLWGARVPQLNAVKSLRLRYVLALSAIAVLVSISWMMMRVIISAQENYSHLITVASLQTGLASRAIHFATLMATTEQEEEYNQARIQLGRAANQMERAHRTLLNGDASQRIPKVWSPGLEAVYFDKMVGLDMALNRFLTNAADLQEVEFGKLKLNTSSYVYLTTYGPHVLEPLLRAAGDEYEAIARKAVMRIERLETMVWVAALAILCLEAAFVFWPLEGRLRRAVGEIEAKNAQLGASVVELEAAREQVQMEKVAVEQASKAKSQFLANMSHELRTPLNAIIGFSETISAQTYGPVGSPKYLEYVQDINYSGRHLLKIINDILDLSKIETGKAELHEEEVDVHEVVDACVRLVRERAHTGGVTLVVDEQRHDFAIYADERMLKQILINLLSNAIKFTPEGGVVTVRYWAHRETGHVLQVSDTGIGIAAEDIPKVLSPFKQVDSDLNRKFDGTGLGLPLSKSLTEMHGGRLTLESEPGRGTTVTVCFPSERVISELATVA